MFDSLNCLETAVEKIARRTAFESTSFPPTKHLARNNFRVARSSLFIGSLID